MAEKTEDAAAPAPAKSKKMLVIVLALVIVALAAGGGWFFLRSQKNLDDGEEEVSAPAKEEHKQPPTYLPLDVMVVNLADPGGERVAQVGVTLELSDAKATEKVKAYLPAIRSAALLLVSQKKAEELLSREGKDQLASEILADASSHFEGEASSAGKGKKKGKDQPENPIRRILFTNFIVQ